uniref:Uncharacterized protein n=1 Tax=Megaselia scalaris TaxID=36166 RepID=T1GM08_MEGSC
MRFQKQNLIVKNNVTRVSLGIQRQIVRFGITVI